MEVLEREPKKVCVVRPPGVQSSERTISEIDGRVKKISFLDTMPVVQQVQEILLRDFEQMPVSTAEPQPFKVRLQAGYILAHCADCFRAGFITVVPA